MKRRKFIKALASAPAVKGALESAGSDHLQVPTIQFKRAGSVVSDDYLKWRNDMLSKMDYGSKQEK